MRERKLSNKKGRNAGFLSPIQFRFHSLLVASHHDALSSSWSNVLSNKVSPVHVSDEHLFKDYNVAKFNIFPFFNLVFQHLQLFSFLEPHKSLKKKTLNLRQRLLNFNGRWPNLPLQKWTKRDNDTPQYYMSNGAMKFSSLVLYINFTNKFWRSY